MIKFSECPMGLFKWHELVYSKFNDTQAVLITSGRVVDFSPDEEVEKL